MIFLTFSEANLLYLLAANGLILTSVHIFRFLVWIMYHWLSCDDTSNK